MTEETNGSSLYGSCGPDLIAALIEAKKSFKPIKKDSVNPFYKSKYASLDAIQEATDPALHANGLVIVQPVLIVEGKPVLRTILLHKSGQYIPSDYPLSLEDKPQEFGKLVTYARRYGRCATLGLVAEDDDDGESSMERPKAAKPAAAKKPIEKVVEQTVEKVERTAEIAPPASKETVLARFKADVVKNFGSFDFAGKDPHSKAAMMMIRETFQVNTWNDVLVDLSADAIRYRIKGRYEQALARTKAAYADAVLKETEIPF